MELAIKEENTKSKVLDFSGVNLIMYLRAFDIKKDTFDSRKRYTDFESQILENYYDEKSQTADRLVIEGEYVGRTYDNLDVIKSKFIKKL